MVYRCHKLWPCAPPPSKAFPCVPHGLYRPHIAARGSEAIVRRAKLQDRRLAKLISRLKYTRISQRSSLYDRRQRQLSRVSMRTSFLRLARAPPKLMASMCISDGLLCDLSGAACPNPKCGATANGMHQAEAKLGRLVSTRAHIGEARNVCVRSVFYRCLSCRARVRINHGSALYGSVGGGSKAALSCTVRVSHWPDFENLCFSSVGFCRFMVLVGLILRF